MDQQGLTANAPARTPIGPNDGRRRRKQRNSRLLLQSAFDLMVGNCGRMPTMEAVAKCADLSLRSGFEHFGTIASLNLAAISDPARALQIGRLIAQYENMPPPELGGLDKASAEMLLKWWDTHLIAMARCFAKLS